MITIPDFPLKVVLKTRAGSSKSISNEFRGINEKGKTYTEKPVGDVVRDDGTLKDTDEMEWPNFPTDLEDDRVLARSNEPANFLDEIGQAFEQNYLSSNQVNHIIFLKLYAGTHLLFN